MAWANETSARTAPKSALGKALHYLLEQWPYLEDGRLEFSNNRAERSIKPFVMGRQNAEQKYNVVLFGPQHLPWLFCCPGFDGYSLSKNEKSVFR